MDQRIKQSRIKAAGASVQQGIPAPPVWPRYTGTSQFVSTSPSGRATIYVDPNLGSAGLQNAQDLVSDADRVMSANDALFGSVGGPVSVIVFALGGRTDGRGGADHLGCNYTSGAAIEICASFGSSARVSALFAAMLSECSMGGNLCGTSAGEALSRWCAAVISNNALSDFATAPQWAQDGMPDFVNLNEGTDQNADSTGCGMAFVSWLMSQGYRLDRIAQELASLGDTATLAQLYANLTSDAASNAWPSFVSAVQALPSGVTNDDPFGSTLPASSTGRTVGIRPLTAMTSSVANLKHEKSEIVQTVQRLEQRFESVLSEPKLDNFDGTVSVCVSDETGKDLAPDPTGSNRACFLVAAGQSCRLEIMFMAGQPQDKSSSILLLDLRIRKGNAASQVTFDVFLDGETIELANDRASVTFDPNHSSRPLTFSFLVPTKRGTHELFVEISQKSRLLQSGLLRFRVSGKRK